MILVEAGGNQECSKKEIEELGSHLEYLEISSDEDDAEERQSGKKRKAEDKLLNAKKKPHLH